ncbi:MAG: restriction endonuclease subunit S [Microthrixaceae bacterium]|nr:restriction endonuclease subunit S [Microthrixaceae bacterium]
MSTAFGDLLATPLRSGFTIPASTRGHGVRMLNMGELFRHPRVPDIEMTRVTPPSASDERAYLAVGDLMFARRSLTLEGAGKCAIIGAVGEPTTWESSIIRARVDRSLASPEYLFYYFRSPAGRRTVETIVEQVAAAGIRLSELAKLRVPTPALAEQQAIAEVLGALDDKIAANTTLVSRSAALAATEFAASIRAGSSAVTISDATTFVARGITPNYSESTDSTMLVLNQKCVRDRRVSLTQARRTLLTRTRPEKTLQTGDILVNSTGQGTLGRVARWTVSETATVDSHITIVRADPALHDVTVFGQGLLAMESQIEALAEGSTGQTELSRVELGRLEIRLPSQDQQSRLGPQLRSLIEVESAFETENRILAEARDALLPQLMSGKLRVRDAEQLASEAGA